MGELKENICRGPNGLWTPTKGGCFGKISENTVASFPK